ncbi:MAG: MerR family transcriptional regulator, thiopeptide resistance regulator [Gammaproteobacteria bacterium]|nr:MerR family transcriptional regulator, thiopeptide resistance regulator [Gammaproteobacteria bacterium]
MAKPKKSESMGAAECAQRTGLTVRALRVYERHGLIAPARSATGWRCYGPKELARINVIVTLKAFGLTLAQIRSVLTTTPPPLAQVLQMQLDALRTRKAAAERGLALVQTALARIQSGHRLPVEELCNLARAIDMSDHQRMTRELINQSITPDEERASMNWWASRPPEQGAAMRDYGAAVRVIFQSLQQLYEKNVDPGATEVQALIDQWKDVALRYQLRDIMLAMLEWNADIARKWLNVGEHSLSRTVSAGKNTPERGVWGFFAAAIDASSWHEALMLTVDEAALLVEKKATASSAPAKALAKRLEQICADSLLGDPLVYARWSAAMQRPDESAESQAARRSGWVLLASVLQAG